MTPPQLAGIKLLAQVQTVEQARRAVAAGVDVIAAQGTEAGGHTGYSSTFPFVPTVVDLAGLTVLLAFGVGVSDMAFGLLFIGVVVADCVFFGAAFLGVAGAVFCFFDPLAACFGADGTYSSPDLSSCVVELALVVVNASPLTSSSSSLSVIARRGRFFGGAM